MELNKLKLLILDLISPVRHVDADVFKSLNEDDWNSLLAIARQHRLEPLLRWRLSREKSSCHLSEERQQYLAARFRQATLRSLTIQRELLLVHRILEAAKIPHVALKGAFLAFLAYPHPALRPLRDLDILVPRDEALTAYQLLLDGGLKRIEAYSGDTAATLITGHHLPPLRSINNLVNIELHARLFHQEKGMKTQPDLSEDDKFWKRIVHCPVAGIAVPFESSTDLLLHMIVHAVYDHQFNNGPLLLSDLAYLLAKEDIDWSLFWRLADERGQTRGCILALALTEHYWGKQPITWPDNHIPSALRIPITDAALMMLRDFDSRSDVSLGNEVAAHTSLSAKMQVLLRKAFPPKAEIATTYPVSAKSLKVYLWYPAKWWRLLFHRVPSYLQSLTQPHLRQEVQTIRDIERWLQTE